MRPGGADETGMDNGRVLVIDDDRRIVRLLEPILDSHFDTGPVLRDRLRKLAPHLLPRMIFMTGNGDSALSQQVMDHFIIEKPFDPTSVRRLVAKVIQASRTEYSPVANGT